MAGKFSIYKYVKVENKGWRYARAAYHPNGKIKPDTVLVKSVNGKNVEGKHPEGSYFLNFNNAWITTHPIESLNRPDNFSDCTLKPSGLMIDSR